MEVTMDGAAVTLLFAGSIFVGLIAEAVARRNISYEWVFAGIGAFLGGVVASEYLGSASDWGPVWSGLQILPAVVGAVLCAGFVEALAWYFDRTPTRPDRPPRAI
jgi:hypothetical protein